MSDDTTDETRKEADVTEDGRFDADAEPSLAWLEQISFENRALVTRAGEDHVRNFHVTVSEVGRDDGDRDEWKGRLVEDRDWDADDLEDALDEADLDAEEIVAELEADAEDGDQS